MDSIIRFLIKIGGQVGKVFIPGETRDSEHVRETFIRSNALGILLYMKEEFPNVQEEEIK